MRDREHEEGAEGEGESSRLPTEHGAWHDTPFQDLKVMTSAEIKSQMINRLSHPGTPG